MPSFLQHIPTLNREESSFTLCFFFSLPLKNTWHHSWLMKMSVIITGERLPQLSSLLKNLWNWVFGVSHSFQFSRKSGEILRLWMAVIYATQPVHCVKLNCLFFADSMEAWWLCRAEFFFFFFEDRLHRVLSLRAVTLVHVLRRLTCMTAKRPIKPRTWSLHSGYIFKLCMNINM